METMRTSGRCRKKPRGFLIILALWSAAIGLGGCKAALASDSEPENLPILQAWSGDYPVSQLHRLPESQRSTRVGYLGTSTIFADVWHAFKPAEKAPEVDFSEDLVVFSRNVDFYNRTSIAKVVLKDGVAEILAIETLSAIPIEDKVAMAMAVIPRAGVKFIQAGSERIPVAFTTPGVLNATYTIEGKEVYLIDGHHAEQAAPGSATEVKTRVFGEPVCGDLDGDGEEDAVAFILQDPGTDGFGFGVEFKNA